MSNSESSEWIMVKAMSRLQMAAAQNRALAPEMLCCKGDTTLLNVLSDHRLSESCSNNQCLEAAGLGADLPFPCVGISLPVSFVLIFHFSLVMSATFGWPGHNMTV